MALGTLADNPDCGLKIVPCGMNYFHAHKFRSRAVIEFGNPIEIPKEMVEQFRRGERREAVGALLDTIYQSLLAVTLTSPDYETLMVCFDSSVQKSDSYTADGKFRLFKPRAVCIIPKGKSFRFRWSSSSIAVL